MNRSLRVAACATTAALGLATLVGTTAVAGAPSASDSGRHHAKADCISKAEYRKAKKNMSRDKVFRIWDSHGKREAHASSGGYRNEVRSFNACGRFSAISAAFDKDPGDIWRLSAKSAVWVG